MCLPGKKQEVSSAKKKMEKGKDNEKIMWKEITIKRNKHQNLFSDQLGVYVAMGADIVKSYLFNLVISIELINKY